MSNDVWMAVSSSSISHRENKIEARYYDGDIDRVVVRTGSGSLYMTLSIAEELFEQLREALQAGALAQAIASGSGLWLSATEFVPAEDVSDLQQKAVA